MWFELFILPQVNQTRDTQHGHEHGHFGTYL